MSASILIIAQFGNFCLLKIYLPLKLPLSISAKLYAMEAGEFSVLFPSFLSSETESDDLASPASRTIRFGLHGEGISPVIFFNVKSPSAESPGLAQWEELSKSKAAGMLDRLQFSV